MIKEWHCGKIRISSNPSHELEQEHNIRISKTATGLHFNQIYRLIFFI
jgi:hypothetical protein